jgi:hypothetical protein
MLIRSSLFLEFRDSACSQSADFAAPLNHSKTLYPGLTSLSITDMPDHSFFFKTRNLLEPVVMPLLCPGNLSDLMLSADDGASYLLSIEPQRFSALIEEVFVKHLFLQLLRALMVPVFMQAKRDSFE